jgi:hypothetical protein
MGINSDLNCNKPVEDIEAMLIVRRTVKNEIICIVEKLKEVGWKVKSKKVEAISVRDKDYKYHVEHTSIRTSEDATFGDIYITHRFTPTKQGDPNPTDYIDVYFRSKIVLSLQYRYDIKDSNITYFSENLRWRLALNYLSDINSDDRRNILLAEAKKLDIMFS